MKPTLLRPKTKEVLTTMLTLYLGLSTPRICFSLTFLDSVLVGIRTPHEYIT